MSEYSAEELLRLSKFIKDMQSVLGGSRDDDDDDEARAWDDYEKASSALAAYAEHIKAAQVDPAVKPHTSAEPVAQVEDEDMDAQLTVMIEHLTSIVEPQAAEPVAQNDCHVCGCVDDGQCLCTRPHVVPVAQGEVVDCPECGTRCTHRTIPMSDDVIHEYTPIAAQPHAAQNTSAEPAAPGETAPVVDLHDRIEFALRDAGFGLDEASTLAEQAAAQPVAQGEVFVQVLASLIAAVSLLRRGGRKAAPSDTMFAFMLADYEKAIEAGRALLATQQPREPS